jgi:hypothetical protein
MAGSAVAERVVDLGPDEYSGDKNLAGSFWDDPAPLAPEREYMSVCLYGEEGTGKSTHLAYMANLGPILAINAEAGLKSRALARRGVEVDNIMVWPRPGEKLTFNGLETLYFQTKLQLQHNPGSVAGVTFDSITEIVRVLLANEGARAFRAAQGSGKPRDRWATERNDYGVVAKQVGTLLRWFRDLECHFGMTALMRRDTDHDGKVAYGPSVTPALMGDIPGFVDMLIHTEINPQGLYVGWTAAHGGKYRAKDRDGVLPKCLPDPTFSRLRAYVDGELTKETDELFQAAKAGTAPVEAPPTTAPEPDAE